MSVSPSGGPTAHTDFEQDFRPTDHPEVHDIYTTLRRSCPVAHTDAFGGYWMLVRYDDVVAAAKDPETFKSEIPFVEARGSFRNIIPLGLNPPEHTFWRKIMMKYYSRAQIARLRPRLRAFVVDALEPLLADGSADVVPGITAVLPPYAVATLFDMGDDAVAPLVRSVRVVSRVARETKNADELVAESIAVWAGLGSELLAERRAHPRNPDIDMMSGFLAAQNAGEPITDEDIVSCFVQSLAAGSDTTNAALTSLLFHLATHPEDQRRLRDEPALRTAAVQEILRLETPLHQIARTTTTTVHLHDRTIPGGELVALNYASANRDPDKFPDPHTFDLDRSSNPHVAFGVGIHRCIGAPLAELEMEILLQEILDRTTWFELDGEPRRRPGTAIAGFLALPLRFQCSPTSRDRPRR